MTTEPADPIARDLHRVIDACTFFDDRGPVPLKPPSTPYFFDEDVDAPRIHGRADTQHRGRPGPKPALAPSATAFGKRILGTMGVYAFGTAEIATLLGCSSHHALEKLRALRDEGVVECIAQAGRALRWRRLRIAALEAA